MISFVHSPQTFQLTQSVLKINFKIVSLCRTETKAKWRHLKKTFLQNIFGGKKKNFGGPEIREEDGVVLQPVFSGGAALSSSKKI